eukprot:COSAG05_NODE_3203_length_2245_cov_3.247903_1_plen_151_part_10
MWWTGENKSWAFISYKHLNSVNAACDAAKTLRTPGDRRSTPSPPLPHILSSMPLAYPWGIQVDYTLFIVHDPGTGVLLRVRKADIEQELFLNEQKGSEGALASVWKRRAPLNEDIMRIREMVLRQYTPRSALPAAESLPGTAPASSFFSFV